MLERVSQSREQPWPRPRVTRDIPGLVMIVAELCDLGVYRHILHAPHALTEARPQPSPRGVSGARALPQCGALRPPGQGVGPSPLLGILVDVHLLPPHLLRGALGYRDDLALNLEVARSGASLQRPALALLQTDRVKVVISEDKNVVLILSPPLPPPD